MEQVGSRAAAQKLIEGGAVTVGGEPRPKRHRVAAGERVRVELPAAPDPSDPAAGEWVPYDVSFEDEHLLVVDLIEG